MESLPQEMLWEICSYLNITETQRLKRTCSYHNRMITVNFLYKYIAEISIDVLCGKYCNFRYYTTNRAFGYLRSYTMASPYDIRFIDRISDTTRWCTNSTRARIRICGIINKRTKVNYTDDQMVQIFNCIPTSIGVISIYNLGIDIHKEHMIPEKVIDNLARFKGLKEVSYSNKILNPNQITKRYPNIKVVKMNEYDRFE